MQASLVVDLIVPMDGDHAPAGQLGTVAGNALPDGKDFVVVCIEATFTKWSLCTRVGSVETLKAGLPPGSSGDDTQA
jgi:hypothetical protein